MSDMLHQAKRKMVLINEKYHHKFIIEDNNDLTYSLLDDGEFVYSGSEEEILALFVGFIYAKYCS
jgi:hypothetical protein